ncbi:hypothetical protein C7B80_29885 [Cyanosarcina cf. burmensis CCALA 770]|nr:hypothetical protein C7B80_29885 [Cyanosarcina cf. burmensis CCALA 770]
MIFLQKVKLAFFTALAIALSAPSAIAQPPPAPDTGTPDGQRTPGGTRPELTGVCKQTAQPLTALVPKSSKGLTTAEYPIFWFYIPYAPKEVHSIEFSLHNREETTTLYRTSLQLPNTPGAIGIPLPHNPEYSLKRDRSYHWYLIVNCQPQDNYENDIVLDGWVTRVRQSPTQVFWYDEVTNRAKRYLLEPQNLKVKAAWTKLLQSVGLEGIAQAPLVNAVSNSQND